MLLFGLLSFILSYTLLEINWKRVKVKNWDYGIFTCKMLPGDKYMLEIGDTILMPGRWRSVLVLVILTKDRSATFGKQGEFTTIFIGSLSNVHK